MSGTAGLQSAKDPMKDAGLGDISLVTPQRAGSSAPWRENSGFWVRQVHSFAAGLRDLLLRCPQGRPECP